jgi:hypothetical protein
MCKSSTICLLSSEYLFAADSEEQQEEWVKKLKFHAGLPPSQQLTSYKAFDEATEQPEQASEPLYANIPAHGPNNGLDSSVCRMQCACASRC